MKGYVNSKIMTMLRDYFTQEEKYVRQYGANTLFFIQCGTFFEVYGLKQNDILLNIDGNKVESLLDVSKFIMLSTDDFVPPWLSEKFDIMCKIFNFFIINTIKK